MRFNKKQNTYATPAPFDAREQAVRTQLLLELSALREYYARLTENGCKVECHKVDENSTEQQERYYHNELSHEEKIDIDNECIEAALRNNKFNYCESDAHHSMHAWDENKQTETLAQSDRDAIEAFFNVDDDFTQEFNNGFGQIKRSVV